MKDDFYKDQYFAQLNERLDTLETKIDSLTQKVVYIYAWATGAGAVSGLVITLIGKFL